MSPNKAWCGSRIVFAQGIERTNYMYDLSMGKSMRNLYFSIRKWKISIPLCVHYAEDVYHILVLRICFCVNSCVCWFQSCFSLCVSQQWTVFLIIVGGWCPFLGFLWCLLFVVVMRIANGSSPNYVFLEHQQFWNKTDSHWYLSGQIGQSTFRCVRNERSSFTYLKVNKLNKNSIKIVSWFWNF